MYAIIHKIKTALDNKETKNIHYENGKIFVYYENDSNTYGIIVCGLVVSFDRYEYDNDKIWFYHYGQLVGHINGILL